MNPQPKRTKVPSEAITLAAKGEPCTMRVPGVCNGDPETTVFIHFRWIGDCGTGIKPSALQGAFGCSACNAWTDSPTPRQRHENYESDRNWHGIRAMVSTQMRLIEMGKLKII